MSLLWFTLGLVLLIVGAELLVKGASRVAAIFRIPPLIIGLTVVAFGTSSPEFAVSIEAAMIDQASIAVGNVIGSNIFNVLLILGLSALIVPLLVSRQLVRFDIPLMIVLSALVLFMAQDRVLGFYDGIILLLGLFSYLFYLFRQSRKEATPEDAPADTAEPHLLRDGGLILAGLVCLVIGSDQLIAGAVDIAAYFGVSELIIGLTIVAAGTSLPELVTSLVAAVHGQREIAVGNVVGSNLFNIMGVLGVASILSPGGIDIPTSLLHFDLLVMLAVAVVCLPVFFTGGVISRSEGAAFLLYYIAYTSYLVFDAMNHTLLNPFSNTMLYFFMPLTLLAIGYSVLQDSQLKTRSK
ncbi:MAG: calcium/sodium antiporter [Pseudomonadales bacterium]|nr:calcium/sodium antiporter [Pseudomonadales bacterium]MCP5331304.1 calcium/sodium antiporter [Pseudomonadales bacterium]MCP5344314.1 calcium/sodium antiporter [Pseudomonadales bacterium]